jgi:hypothetical protein
MTIESNCAQVKVEDSETFAGVNINRGLSGYAADFSFWGGKTYVAKRKDDPFVHVLQVPSERWLQDLKDDGWIIVGELSELANVASQPRR